VNLHAIHEVRVERGGEDGPHVGMAVTEARETLAGVEVEVGATSGVVEE
jgi:hypothetical protein